MTHIWLRAEERPNETRVGLTPEGVTALLQDGYQVTVEASPHRVIPDAAYKATGAKIAPFGSWPTAPKDAVIFGLKELPSSDAPLHHRHILFGHAYKGQPDGLKLLKRFKAGGGTLYDLESLVDPTGKRVAAFGYWAGYAGAAVTLLAWAAQQRCQELAPLTPYGSEAELRLDVQSALVQAGHTRPTALVIGVKGRVGAGATALCTHMGVPVTGWDVEETAHGGPFPEILAHELFFNCILARPGTPVFVSQSATTAPRRLSLIGDIACDPTSDFNPVPLYDAATSWDTPIRTVHTNPGLSIMAIDNLPSLLPQESSEDFAAQLLPHLRIMGDLDTGPWLEAKRAFEHATSSFPG
ncbi:MAG: saccharopine dehydrogenase [Pseudomonadota bacterium]